MASEKHNFIVSAIARKIRQDGFRIIYLEGKYQDIDTKKFDIPPKIINHKPDIIGEKDNMFFCIGEAKTKTDIFSERTKNQIIDFLTIVRLSSGNKLVLGIPLNAKENLEKLLIELGIVNQKQIEIIRIPEELLPYEEEI
ncbi:MAG TPA: hypothetical protein PL107_03730 [Candidatus Marinimicrobia bacterium]|jgi:hypothetical protein|nr:hypothetical protein [Candidatus Neomarinimicrobiota bacterium]